MPRYFPPWFTTPFAPFTSLPQALDDLVRSKVKDPYDFEWQKQARFYWHEEKKTVQVSICDVDFEYCFEYLGLCKFFLGGGGLLLREEMACVAILTGAASGHYYTPYTPPFAQARLSTIINRCQGTTGHHAIDRHLLRQPLPGTWHVHGCDLRCLIVN